MIVWLSKLNRRPGIRMSDDSSDDTSSRGVDGRREASPRPRPPPPRGSREALVLTPEEEWLTAQKQEIIAGQKDEIQALEAISAELSTLLTALARVRRERATVEHGLSDLRPDARKRSLEREFTSAASSVIGEAKASESMTRVWEGRQLNAATEYRRSVMNDIKGIRRTVAEVEQSLRQGPVAVSSPDTQPAPPDLIQRLEELAGQAKDDGLVASGTTIQRCPYNSERKLDGIIAWMTGKFGGNPATKQEIVVTASGCLQPARFSPDNACNLEGNSVFVSANQPDQWICYDFKHRRVRLTHYSIRSRFDGFKGSNNPKSWVFEGSPNGDSWVTLDVREDNSELNDKDVTAAWKIAEADEVRLVRLRLTSPSHSGKYYLAISGFELFGSISNV